MVPSFYEVHIFWEDPSLWSVTNIRKKRAHFGCSAPVIFDDRDVIRVVDMQELFLLVER